jgi:ubiquinone/menaquinone biosynthesis C-methylase UbiE
MRHNDASMTDVRLPYFDYLLSELNRRNPTIEKSFGRHVHWGYWADPRNATHEDDDFAQAAERLTLELCQLAQITEGGIVLDAGCGFGGTIASLNERFQRLQLVGLNIDARQLKRANQQVPPLHGNSIEFRHGDACDLPFPNGSFDRVLAVECIFHFPSRETFFREAARVLTPGGTLTLSDFVPSPWFRPICRLGVTRGSRTINSIGRWDVSATLRQYRHLARRAGLIPTAARDITAHTLPTYPYLQHVLARDLPHDRGATVFRHLLGLTRLLGAMGLLNYYLLSFSKP